LAARALESVDIDAHAGKKSTLEVSPTSTGILPFESPSFSVYSQEQKSWQHGARRRTLQDFEKTLEAERYAHLLGRPQTRTNKDLERFDFSLKQTCLPKKVLRGFSAISCKCADHGELSVASTSASISVGDELSESGLDRLSEPSPSENSQDAKLRSTIEIMSSDEGSTVHVPLGLRRVMTSLFPRTHEASGRLPKCMDKLIVASVQAFPKSQQRKPRQGQPARFPIRQGKKRCP
jgi:hypothetical protein